MSTNLCVLVYLVREEWFAPSDGNHPILEPFGRLPGGEAGPPAPVALPAASGGGSARGSHFLLGSGGAHGIPVVNRHKKGYKHGTFREI